MLSVGEEGAGCFGLGGARRRGILYLRFDGRAPAVGYPEQQALSAWTVAGYNQTRRWSEPPYIEIKRAGHVGELHRNAQLSLA